MIVQSNVYRRRQINLVRPKAEKVIQLGIEPLLQSRFKSLTRDLRKSNLRKRLSKNDGLLHKADDEEGGWQAWEAHFDEVLFNSLGTGAGYFWDVEQRYWVSHDYPIFPFEAEDVLAQYRSADRNKKRIKKISKDTEVRTNEILTEWYKTDAGLPELIRMLEPLFGARRAALIATTEAAYIASSVSKDQMLNYNIKQWTWDAFDDGVVCELCLSLMAQSRIKPFTLDDPMPPDPSHPKCILPGQVVSIPNLSGGAKSFYKGVVVEVTTNSGNKIAVTPNHPILTSRGWVAAGLLNESDNVISHSNPQRMVESVDPNNHQRPALVEDIFASLKMALGMVSVSMKATPEDFNGDARSIQGEVEIVYPQRELGYRMQTDFLQRFKQEHFSRVHLAHSLNSLGVNNLLSLGMLATPNSDVSRLGLSDALGFRHPRPFDSLGLTLGSPLYSIFNQGALDDLTVNSPFLGELLFGNTGLIKSDKIRNIRQYDFSGHVYDLSSDFYEVYTCNGIITHNCRCGVYYVGVDAEVFKLFKGGPGSGRYPAGSGGGGKGSKGSGDYPPDMKFTDSPKDIVVNEYGVRGYYIMPEGQLLDIDPYNTHEGAALDHPEVFGNDAEDYNGMARNKNIFRVQSSPISASVDVGKLDDANLARVQGFFNDGKIPKAAHVQMSAGGENFIDVPYKEFMSADSIVRRIIDYEPTWVLKLLKGGPGSGRYPAGSGGNTSSGGGGKKMSLESAVGLITENSPVNTVLRSGKELDETEKEIVETLDSSMSANKEAVTTYRGLTNMNSREKYQQVFGTDHPKVGTEFTDKGYSSTSVSEQTASNFAHKGEAPMMLEVRAPAGSMNMIDLKGQGNWGAEGEILIGRDTTFRIDKISYNEPADMQVYHVTVVP